MKLLDLTKKQFGRWKVIERAENNKSNSSMWLCECECGTKRVVLGYDLKAENSTSCGCYNKEAVGDRRRTTDRVEQVKKYIYNNTKVRHNKKGFDNKTLIPFKNFSKMIDENCCYCGVEPNSFHKDPIGDTIVYYNGLDRIDNNKGYTIDNVKTCCYDCNISKNDRTHEDFCNWIKKVYQMLHNENVV